MRPCFFPELLCLDSCLVRPGRVWSNVCTPPPVQVVVYFYHLIYPLYSTDTPSTRTQFKFTRIFDTSIHTLQYQTSIAQKVSYSDKSNIISNEHQA